MKDETSNAVLPAFCSLPIHPSSLIPHPFFNVLEEISEYRNPRTGAKLRQCR